MKWEKFNKMEVISVWHYWFAWHPVKLTEKNTVVWLEYVERKGITRNSRGRRLWDFQYRMVIKRKKGRKNEK